MCYIREKAEKGAPDGICCAEGSVRFRTQMSENSRLESIKGVTELKSNKPAKVKSTFEAINFFKKNCKVCTLKLTVKSHDEHTWKVHVPFVLARMYIVQLQWAGSVNWCYPGLERRKASSSTQCHPVSNQTLIQEYSEKEQPPWTTHLYKFPSSSGKGKGSILCSQLKWLCTASSVFKAIPH